MEKIPKELMNILRGPGMMTELDLLEKIRTAAIKSELESTMLDSVFLDATYEELAKRRNDVDIGDSVPLWHSDVNRFDREECNWITGPNRRSDIYFLSHGGDPRFVVKEKSRFRRGGGSGRGAMFSNEYLTATQSQNTFSAAPVTAIKRGNSSVRLILSQTPEEQDFESKSIKSKPELELETETELKPESTNEMDAIKRITTRKWNVEKIIHLSFPFLDQLSYVCGMHSKAVERIHRHYSIAGKKFHRMVHNHTPSSQQQQPIEFSGGDFPRRVFDISFLRETAVSYIIYHDIKPNEPVIRATAETRSDASTAVLYSGQGIPLIDAIRIAKANGVQSLVNLTIHILETTIYLHRRGIAHCNIRPQNMIATQNDQRWRVAFIGLSCASFWSANECRPLFGLGYPGYTPPDILADGSRRRATFEDCTRTDWWAIGCIIFAMFSEKWTAKAHLPWVNVNLELTDRRAAASFMMDHLNGNRNGPDWKFYDDTPSWIRLVVNTILLCPVGAGRSIERVLVHVPWRRDPINLLKNTRYMLLPSDVYQAKNNSIMPFKKGYMDRYKQALDKFSVLDEEITALLFIGDGRAYNISKPGDELRQQRMVDVALVCDSVLWSILCGLTKEDASVRLPVPSDIVASLSVLFVGGIAAVSLATMRTDAAVMVNMIDILGCSDTVLGKDVFGKTVSTDAADFISRCSIEYLKFCGSYGPVSPHPLGIVMSLCNELSVFKKKNKGSTKGINDLSTFIGITGIYLRHVYIEFLDALAGLSSVPVGMIVALCVNELNGLNLFSKDDWDENISDYTPDGFEGHYKKIKTIMTEFHIRVNRLK